MDKKIIEKLNIKGVYFTHLVKELTNVFLKAKKPLSINEIIGIFKKQNFYPYQSSLYRQLNRLTNLRVIERILFSDGVPRYFFVYKDKHFYHFRCQKCGYGESNPKKNHNALIGKSGNYFIMSKIIIIEGFCDKCLNSKK